MSSQGHQVVRDTVARLLREHGYSLQANAKTLEGAQHPDRDAQFRYLNEQVAAHLSRREAGDQRGHQEEGTCATRRLAISLAQLGGIRRSIPGSNG